MGNKTENNKREPMQRDRSSKLRDEANQKVTQAYEAVADHLDPVKAGAIAYSLKHRI